MVSFGRAFLYCLALVFFLSCVLSGFFMVSIGVRWVLEDINLSIIPLQLIGLPYETVLGLSILSSVSEVVAGLLFLDFKEVEEAIRNETKYRVLLPILNEKTLLGARIFFVLMFIYDIATNIWGSFIQNPNPLSVLIQTMFLTLSEYFVIIGGAFFLSAIWVGCRTLAGIGREESSS